ncbi:exodeoxyribonuclease V subunit alpha [Spongisporangium articulatum]|uniref:RecBCD enzyme subunit RecD n=1 Tax=Spongisporangium articulatum TaxID=3362603 RepID=A0ABW8AR51_9ACTN
MTGPATRARDGLGAEVAARASGLLAAFNDAGLITAADVQVATRLGAIAGETDETVQLAVALVVRSTRHGSVVLDLRTAQQTVTADDVEALADLSSAEPAAETLEWPEPEAWVARCAASSLVGPEAPLRMEGGRLWLARYREQEELVARELLARVAEAPTDLDLAVLETGLDRLFAPADADQREAARIVATHRVSVLAGGPGTGKTTTVSRLLALLREQRPDARIALAAPTGKAAARLEEAVRSSSARLAAADRDRLGELPAVTLHRLLGWRPGGGRPRHDAANRLPREVVVVDEASMVSLTQMARLLEALRPSTRLVLVGDPEQLASVEAGAVLGDLVAAEGGPAVARLTTNRRFGGVGVLPDLAAAITTGDADRALALLRSGAPEVEFVEVEEGVVAQEAALAGVRGDVETTGARLHAAAETGDAARALEALEEHRVLCAHRLGPRGVQYWGQLAAGWVAATHPLRPGGPLMGGHYPGQPLLVTENDYEAGLYNGDTGVVVRVGGELVAMFGRGADPIPVPLGRLGAVRDVHAMTVHRSQGSQFDRVTVVLPPADSPLGTRQTLYTAVTRARRFVRVIGSADSFAAAVERLASRATGLREHLQS